MPPFVLNLQAFCFYFVISNCILKLFQTCCILIVFIFVIFAILWCALIFKQEGKGFTKKVDVVPMELSAGASSPSMLARGMEEHCIVSQSVAV